MAEHRKVDLPFRVRYAETDQAGVAYYANYLVWFEMGRSEYCRAVGYPYARIEEGGMIMVVAEAGIRYKRAARYDDPLIVRTRMTEARRRTCRFEYEIVRQDSGGGLAEGFTVHVVVDRDNGRPIAMPADLLELFNNSMTSQ